MRDDTKLTGAVLDTAVDETGDGMLTAILSGSRKYISAGPSLIGVRELSLSVKKKGGKKGTCECDSIDLILEAARYRAPSTTCKHYLRVVTQAVPSRDKHGVIGSLQKLALDRAM